MKMDNDETNKELFGKKMEERIEKLCQVVQRFKDKKDLL